MKRVIKASISDTLYKRNKSIYKKALKLACEKAEVSEDEFLSQIREYLGIYDPLAATIEFYLENDEMPPDTVDDWVDELYKDLYCNC